MPGNQRRTRQAQSFRKECLSERTDTTESIGFLKSFYLPFYLLVCSRLPFWLFAAICCSAGGNREHLGKTSGFPDVSSSAEPVVGLAE